jgi:hypothetical protein
MIFQIETDRRNNMEIRNGSAALAARTEGEGDISRISLK